MNRFLVVIIVLGCIVALVPLAFVAFVGSFLDVKIADMTRDVVATAGIHPLMGLLSSLGILLWWTSASVWSFTALVWHAKGYHGTEFFVYSAALSAYLGVDDLFLIHEVLAPLYLKVPELAVYGLLMLATAYYLWRYRQVLFRPDGLLLLTALGFLSLSVVIDTLFESWSWQLGDWEYFVEDGFKWLGIFFWTSFCMTRCFTALRDAPPQQSS